MPLPSDVILSDIVENLSKPGEYVRLVLLNMFDYKKTNGLSYIRLGTTGNGIRPNYRIQSQINALGELMTSGGLSGEPESVYFEAFNGSNHERLPFGARELQSENWSSRAMTLQDVQALMGGLRKK